MPSTACGKKRLLEMGISRMSRTTPMRKSRRMNVQPISATHRYTPFSPTTATTNPQKTPSSAMAANTQSVNAPARRASASCTEALP